MGGAIIGGAVGGRRGAAVGAATGAVVGATSPQALAWPLLLAAWSLLGPLRREIASGIFTLLPVNCANRTGLRLFPCDAAR